MLPITVTPTKEHHCKFIKIYKVLCEEISMVFQLRSYYILLSFQIQYSTCISFQCASWMRYFNGERYSQSHWYVKKGFLSFSLRFLVVPFSVFSLPTYSLPSFPSNTPKVLMLTIPRNTCAYVQTGSVWGMCGGYGWRAEGTEYDIPICS